MRDTNHDTTTEGRTDDATSSSDADDGSLTLRRQAPAAVDVRISSPASSRGELWRQAWDAGLAPCVVTAARTLAAGRTESEYQERLDAAGVDALDLGGGPPLFRDLATSLTRSTDSDWFWHACRVSRALGGRGRPLGVTTTAEDIHDGPLALLRAAGTTPSVAIHLDRDVLGDAHDERDLVWFLARLAESVDLALVGSRVTLRYLWDRHRDVLPASVSGPAVPRRDSGPVDAEQLLADDELGERSETVLCDLADEQGDTLTRHTLEAMQGVSRTRVAQVVSSLEEHGLAEQYGRRGEKRVTLTPAGKEYLSLRDEENARQRRVDDFVSDSLHSSGHGRDSTRSRGGGNGGGDPRRKGTGAAPVQPLSPSEAAGAIATGAEGTVSVADTPMEAWDDCRSPGFFYDARQETVAVAVQYTNPLVWTVSTARALASEFMFSRVLTEERLEDADHDFAELFEEYRGVLWGGRCLGYLGNDLEGAEDYVEALRDARDRIENLTTKLAAGEYDDADRFCGEIVRAAHGLIGTVTHLLDLVDVDLVRELRFPDAARDWSTDEWEDKVTETVATAAAIGAEYEGFNAYRQLYEDRDEKRESAITPTVDAEDPHGALIGSFVLRGAFNGKREAFADAVRDALETPGELHEDAPEIAVPIEVREHARREQYAEAVEVVCHTKNLRPTREAVSLCRLLVGSPYVAAEALNHLGTEAERREIRLDEVRFALSRLDAGRLVPHDTRAVGEIVAALLTAERALSAAELAERADVARSTVSRHRDRLAALGLLCETDEGLRLPLPFHTKEDRRETRLPWFLGDDGVLVRDVLYRVAEQLVEDADRWGDPDDPVCGAWLRTTAAGLPDLGRLTDEWDWLDPWLSVLEGTLDAPAAIDTGGTETVAFGAPTDQTSLQGAPSTAAVP